MPKEGRKGYYAKRRKEGRQTVKEGRKGDRQAVKEGRKGGRTDGRGEWKGTLHTKQDRASHLPDLPTFAILFLPLKEGEGGRKEWKEVHTCKKDIVCQRKRQCIKERMDGGKIRRKEGRDIVPKEGRKGGRQ